jgi:hypothetical protein
MKGKTCKKSISEGKWAHQVIKALEFANLTQIVRPGK